MGLCELCGQKAGWFSTEHDECRAKQNRAREEMVALARLAVENGTDPSEAERQLARVAQTGFLDLPDNGRLRKFLLDGWLAALDTALEDHVLSLEEQTRLVTFLEKASIGKEDLEPSGGWNRFIMALALREIMEGVTPKRLALDGSPFNLQKGESLVWAFNGTTYMEERVRREYVGGSTGVSVRVVKGVYVRSSSYRGRAVETSELVHVDSGVFGFTDRNLYFAGPSKSLRIPYAKIVNFLPYSDGIGVFRDAASAKRQVFVTDHGWFVYNAVVQLASR